MGKTEREVSRLIDRNRAGYILAVALLLVLAFVIHRPDRRPTKAVETVEVKSELAVTEADTLNQTPKKKNRSGRSSRSKRNTKKRTPNTPKSPQQFPLSPLDSPL